jgi:hypothetical protein
MLKTLAAICVVYAAMHGIARAECSTDVAFDKSFEVSDVLAGKLQTKGPDASKMMSEMGFIMGNGSVTEQTCKKLDELIERARTL